jgi:hypothetical protein
VFKEYKVSNLVGGLLDSLVFHRGEDMLARIDFGDSGVSHTPTGTGSAFDCRVCGVAR